MRLRSSGLGTSEVEAEIVDVKKVNDLVIFCVNTTKPVKWRTRMGFQEEDLRTLVRAILKPKNLKFVITGLLFPNKKVERTKDFWKEAMQDEI
jgi:hypothetical protein